MRQAVIFHILITGDFDQANAHQGFHQGAGILPPIHDAHPPNFLGRDGKVAIAQHHQARKNRRHNRQLPGNGNQGHRKGGNGHNGRDDLHNGVDGAHGPTHFGAKPLDQFPRLHPRVEVDAYIQHQPQPAKPGFIDERSRQVPAGCRAQHHQAIFEQDCRQDRENRHDKPLTRRHPIKHRQHPIDDRGQAVESGTFAKK